MAIWNEEHKVNKQKSHPLHRGCIVLLGWDPFQHCIRVGGWPACLWSWRLAARADAASENLARAVVGLVGDLQGEDRGRQGSG